MAQTYQQQLRDYQNRAAAAANQYQTNLANYQAMLSQQANAAQNAAALRAASISANASIAAANAAAAARRYQLDYDKSRFSDVYGSILANDPRRRPEFQDMSAYYAANPITRDSLGLGGDYYTPEQERILINQGVANTAKIGAKDRRAIKGDIASRGMSYESPILTQLLGKSMYDQAKSAMDVAATVRDNVLKANRDYALAGQQSVEDQVAGVAASENARQQAIGNYMSLLSSLV